MKPEQMEKALDEIEHQFRFHGIWQRPEEEYPRIHIRPEWKPSVAKLAEILNQIFYIRSLPAVTRLYGPLQDGVGDEFLYDYTSPEERQEYVENALSRLVAELELLPQFDPTLLDIEET